MLELSQVLSDISAMGVETSRRTISVSGELDRALKQAALDPDAWEAARVRIDAISKQPWLAAKCGDTPPATLCALPYDAPATYTAIATDGSQIPLDRHAIAPCYLLNVGEIVLHYGTGERPRLTSQATLHYKDEEIFQRTARGEPMPLSEKIIANRRFLAESAALARLIAENRDRMAIALVDDPLIVWTPPNEPESEQRLIIGDFCKMLEAGQAAGTPVAGYISRPGSRDVVGALRLTLCEPGCSHAASSPCTALMQLTDARLFDTLLPNIGDRSPIFGSAASNQSLYPDDQKVFFFYLNVGSEIARVEAPRWVVDNPDFLDRLHVLVTDQARKGLGYPIGLSEAHERAIVRGPERDAFFRLVEAAFIRQNIPVLQTRKALAKRTRLL